MTSVIEWKKVEEEKPEHSGEVLASNGSCVFPACYYEHTGWVYGYRDYPDHVHVECWAYFPDAPVDHQERS